MKLAWLTDIHLVFLDEQRRAEFYRSIPDTAQAIIISGDIADANNTRFILEEMAEKLHKPIYFVLGNHDYYHGNITEVRQEMKLLTDSNAYLFWLGACDPIPLDQTTVLVGVDGWADGRFGNYANSPVRLNDSRLIMDLLLQSMLGRIQLLDKMQELADADANSLLEKLNKGLIQNSKKIIIVTHVPPFKETTRYMGHTSDDDYLPFFGSKATGDVLLKFAQSHTDIKLIVFCGHTHEPFTYHALDNLTVYVGKAEYNQPSIQWQFDMQEI